MADTQENLMDELVNKAAGFMQQEFDIPIFKGVSTAPAKAEVAKASKSRDELAATVGKEKERFATATEEAKAAIKATGKAGSDLAYADQQQAENLARVHDTTNKLFGLGVDASDAIAVLTTENRKSKPSLDKELTNIKEMQSVGPLDNPVEWLINGLQLPSRIQAYNTAATKFDNNQKMIEDGVKDATNMALQLSKGLPTITAAQAKATADKAVSEAAKLAALADQNLAIHSVDFAQKKLASDMSIADVTIKTTQLDVTQAHDRYQAQINAINIASTQAERLLKSATLLENIADKKALDVVLQRANEKLGYPAGTLNRATIKTFKKEEQDNFMGIGASNSFGVTVLDAFENVRRAKVGPMFSEDSSKVLTYINDKLGHIKSNLAQDIKENIAFKTMLPEQKRAVVSEKLNDAIALDIQGAEMPGNFFHELSPAKVMMADKEFVNTTLGKILQPLATVDQEITPKVIAQTILAGYNNDPSEAGAVLADYYRKNISIRDSAIPYEVMGIQLPAGYKISIRTGIFSGISNIDLTKPGDATKYMTLLATQKRTRESYLVVSPGPDIWTRQ